ncbi:hypothetical protein BH24ACT26_BH24ACT26_01670 [soil metagenome]
MRTAPGSSRLLESFLEVSVALTHNPDMDGVLVGIVERSMELTGARYGAAVTLASDGGIENFLHRGLSPEEVAVLPHLPRGKGLLGLVLTERGPVRTDDIGSHPASVGFPDSHVPMAAFLGVPMQLHGDLVGALYLTKSPGAPSFTNEDQELITAMASMAAVGVQNARLFSAERERAEAGAVLHELATTVRASLDVDRVLATTVEALGRAAKVERCFIRLVGAEEGGPLDAIAYEWNATGVRSLQDEPAAQFPVSSMAAMTRSTQWSDDIAADGRLIDPQLPGEPDHLLAHGIKAALATPLEWGDELMGVVTFQSETPRRWSESDIALIEGASREVATALDHARLYDEAVRAAEKLRELDHMRSEFVSVVSHELRSPMTVVAGIADILEKRYDDLAIDARTELIETLGREARRLTRLVSDVLDLESNGRGIGQLRMEAVDLVELARESVADAGEAGRTKLVAEAGDATTKGDRDRIKQVLLNLLSNAAKFSEHDAPITVAVAPTEDSVRVSIADHGQGISEDDRHLLFKRFSRLQTTTTSHPGSGIGLYLSKTIVERHGGEIWLESVPGRGSTFCFRLPRS